MEINLFNEINGLIRIFPDLQLPTYLNSDFVQLYSLCPIKIYDKKLLTPDTLTRMTVKVSIFQYKAITVSYNSDKIRFLKQKWNFIQRIFTSTSFD